MSGLPMFVELGCEVINYFTTQHSNDSCDFHLPSSSAFHHPYRNAALSENVEHSSHPRYIPPSVPILASASAASAPGSKRRYKNQLPSPEPERRDHSAQVSPENYAYDSTSVGPDRRRESSLERESETSERVLRAYEAERSDPPRKVDTVLPEQARPPPSNHSHDHRPPSNYDNMSRANGHASEYTRDDAYDAPRPRSQPSRSRYADDESDYDEREGKRYRGNSGRGYEDDREYDRDFDREVIETERYRGPARPYEARRMDSSGNRSNYDSPYGPGAVAPYRRSQADVTELTRRSHSRGRRDRYDRDDERSRSRSYSDSRSRSRSKGRGFKDELDKYFDTSAQGLGVGIAGAVAGGLAGRHFGARSEHKNRDIIIGALIGGLGVNAAEHKYREWKEEKDDRRERDDRMLEPRYEGRSKSSIR